MLWLAGAALGAGLSAIQSANENADRKKQKRKYLEYLDKAKVDPLEEQKLLDSTSDVYMGQTMNALNSSVGQGNLYNRDTQMALIKAKALNARAGALTEQKRGIFDFNKKIDLQKAGAELQMPDQSLDFGAIAAGAMGGAQVGMGIESAIEENAYSEAMRNKFFGEGDKAGLDYGKDFGLNQVIPNTVKGINEGLYKDWNNPLTLNKELPSADFGDILSNSFLPSLGKVKKNKYNSKRNVDRFKFRLGSQGPTF